MEIAMIPKHDWGDIPIEIVAKIREHIELYDDYESFLEVCSSWRLAIKKLPTQYINKKHTQLPWLILADEDNSLSRRYYSLTKCKFLKIDLPRCLFPLQMRRYFSSRGWLISVARNISKSNGVDNYFNITIFNPFSNNNVIIETPLFHIRFHRALDWEDYMLGNLFIKFDVSTCPNNAKDSDDDFVVAMIFGDYYEVAYWRLGHVDTWVESESFSCEDLCFFRGELYATKEEKGECVVISFGDLKDHTNSGKPKGVARSEIVTDIPSSFNNYYLVESKDDELDQAHKSSLLVIHRVIVVESYEEDNYKTVSFNVFKFNVDNGNVEEVKNLGNRAIFVGYNSTFSVNVDGDHACKADCIYYTDDSEKLYYRFRGGGRDMGIYSLRQGNTLPFYEGPSQFSDMNPPTWIELSSI